MVSGKQASLNSAQRAKNDEFYTRLEDIEREVQHYRDQFRDKVVFLNCDDPYESDFFKYFAMSFNHLGLKKLIAVSYAGSPIVGSMLSLFDIAGLEDAPLPKEPYKVEITEVPDINGDGAIDLVDVEQLLKTDANTISMLEGDGSFDSPESIELLEQSDIVVTNPPFSLFRAFVALLFEYNKKFLILGNLNSVTAKEIWPLIQNDQMWLGVTRTGTGQMWFRVTDDAPDKTGQKIENGVRYQTVGSSAWYTNLDHSRRHEEIPLFRNYADDISKYATYANYDALDVSKVVDIPVDYDGPMGVPITYLGKHNPDQFEILGYSGGLAKPMAQSVPAGSVYSVGGPRFYVYESENTYRRLFDRVVIKRKK